MPSLLSVLLQGLVSLDIFQAELYVLMQGEAEEIVAHKYGIISNYITRSITLVLHYS